MKITQAVDQSLPDEMLSLLQTMGKVAAGQNIHLYLVGGAARNCFIKQATIDIDLTSAAPVKQLVELFTVQLGAQLIQESQFQTAKMLIAGKSVDLATHRSEVYSRPGSLPQIRAGTLMQDLNRRDFTINALAISLHPSDWATCHDPAGGIEDIHQMRIRTLHEMSFRDDATRILRAIRYECRLGFHLSRETLFRLKRDLHYLEAVSPIRMYHEFLNLLGEPVGYQALRRISQLGILSAINNGLGQIIFTSRLRILLKKPYSPDFKLCALTYAATSDESLTLSRRLSLNKKIFKQIANIRALKQIEKDLTDVSLRPNDIVTAIEKYGPSAIEVVGLLSSYRIVRKRLARYLNQWRVIRPQLTGADLVKIGVPKGPMLKFLLGKLRTAKLNGAIRTRKGEIAIIKAALSETANTLPISPIS